MTLLRGRKKLFLFTFIAANLVEQPTPEIKIPQGRLNGRISKNGDFFEFLGIPYATTNEENRFQPPLPPPSWDGVYRAVDEHYTCPQLTVGGILIGNEDCLKLNVYVPAKAEKPLPVMVYIHGGAFLIGSGSKLVYGPEFLVKHNVIVITINYRLGALGFVCLGIKEAPGNAGLRDQIAALKWVKQNIAAFGGDPDNVTLFGESAGATSTSILVMSNTTEGLFNRVIIQSGSFVTNWGINRDPVSASSMLAKEFGFNTKDPHELYHILKSIPYNALASKRITKPWNKYFETALIHLPCVEKPFNGIDTIIPDLPYKLLESSRRKNISVIIGFNDREGLFLLSRETDESMRKRNDGYLFASDIQFETNEEAVAISNKIKEFYFGKEPIGINDRLKMAEVHTGISFAVPQMLESEAMCSNDNTKCRVYNYIFKYDGWRNVVKLINRYGHEKGAAHGDELFYLFDARVWPLFLTYQDRMMIKRMTKMWTNFAKYDNPTPEITSELPVKWEPSTNTELKFLYIDSEIKMGPNPRLDEFLIWKNVYARHHTKHLSY